ncbi:MAG: DUF1801 domain-containing protein [Sphingomonas sp.]|nr:DUF1801 domain-containing protein [Sphingomonas sp.]MDX3884001.1 DUF1801 domain-containing protein [Sphingomonas sp.]
MNRLFRLPGAVSRDPNVDLWFAAGADELRSLARLWFDRMRACGPDVRELLHDEQPTACVGGAAFGYVDAFTAPVNAGFFHGAALEDPAGLLEGTGKRMRHIKLRRGQPVDDVALGALLAAAYRDIRLRLESAS